MLLDSDDLSLYLDEIGRYSLISSEEEAILVRRISEGDELARQQLITANLRLVVSIAKQFQRSDVDLADLIQEGNTGLIKAVDGFDYRRGTRFTTFADATIRNTLRDLYNRRAQATLSLDWEYEQDVDMKELLPDASAINPEEEAENTMALNRMGTAFATLTSDERNVIKLFAAGFTSDDISKKLQKTLSEIKAVQSVALRKLAHPARLSILTNGRDGP